ncbi:ribokinase [Garciella nitratireducens]|uniref:Ribokinase n=1 Tax=Garciella nitratireducens DSM 15102 TaxID=1121911 RepID=A0A1T4LM63_9FIRM|nr:ribokinase [Garciella nitratireducens]SJZ55830.1 ribokinase [Garciella nitratireducens DSM 15102]
MITVIGSLNMDLVINTNKIPRPGETVIGKNFKQIPGGKGANQADAAAKLGAQVNMIGAIGKDSIGDKLKMHLKQDGVNIQSIVEKEGKSTGVATVIVEESGNNAITVIPGANYELQIKDVQKYREIIINSDILVTQLEIPQDAVKEALKIAKQERKITILNPAPAAELDKDILKYVDILTPNETELEYLSGHKTDTFKNVEIAGKTLLNQGIKKLVVTLGEKGCLYICENKTKYFPAYKVKTVDTTAAGDGFNAALAVSLSKGETIEEAIKFATKVAAMTVTKEGAQISLPLKKEVDHFEKWIHTQKLV